MLPSFAPCHDPLQDPRVPRWSSTGLCCALTQHHIPLLLYFEDNNTSPQKGYQTRGIHGIHCPVGYGFPSITSKSSLVTPPLLSVLSQVRPPIPTRLNDGKDGAPNPAASSHPFLRISTGHQHVGSSFCTTWDLQGAGKAQWGQVPLLHPAEVLPCVAGADPGHPGESHRVTLLSLPTLLHPEINPTQVCWSILMFAFIFMRLKAVFV